MRGRAAAEARMTDTCRVESVGEVITADDGTSTAASTPVYEGPCRLRPAPPEDDPRGQQGAAPVGSWSYTVSLPMSATGLAYGQRLTVLASPLDPDLVGFVMRVGTVESGGQITARRLRCTEVSR
jgi:Family of unknown function (DUF6093)